MDEQERLLSNLNSCIVPSCNDGNDRPLTSCDFESFTSSIDDLLAAISSTFLNINSSLRLEDDIICHLIVICGQHAAHSLWTTDLSTALCCEMFESISSYFQEHHGHSVFQDTKILKKTLALLRPYLLKPTFKCNPAAVACYSWILKQIKSPFLGDCLSDLLPSALIISDDFEPHNIKTGFDCLHHIVENVALERLKWYGQDEVMLDALKKNLYNTDPDIVSSQLPCYVALMRKHMQPTTSLKSNQFDGVIKTTLFNMYVENKLDLRRIYASNFADMIEARGLGVTRHLTMIFKVLSEYTLEPSTTAQSLQALKQILKVCWCRGLTVCDGVVTILTKLLIDFSANPTKYDDEENIISMSHHIGRLLREAFPERIAEFVEHFCAADSIDEKLRQLVQRVLSEIPDPTLA